MDWLLLSNLIVDMPGKHVHKTYFLPNKKKMFDCVQSLVARVASFPFLVTGNLHKQYIMSYKTQWYKRPSPRYNLFYIYILGR